MVENAKGFVMKFGNDWTMNLAAMLAYNILTAIVPILLALLTILSLVLQGNHDLVVNIQNGILGSMPGNLRSVIDIKAALNNLYKNTGVLFILSFVGLLIAGTNLFGAMENAFSIIYRTKSRDIIPQKVMSLAMLVLFLVLAPLMVGASTLIALISSGAHSLIRVNNGVTQVVWQAATLTASALIAFVLFLVIYIVVPNMPLSLRHAWRGAAVGGILLVLIDLIFPAYSTLISGKPDNYGATAGMALVIMAWLWLFATVLLLGAEINSYAMGMRATPGDLATEFHHDRVHDQGKDVPPAHSRTQAGAAGEQRADALDKQAGGQSTSPGQEAGAVAVRPRSLPRTTMGAIGGALGASGRGVLIVVWLAVRLARRKERPTP